MHLVPPKTRLFSGAARRAQLRELLSQQEASAAAAATVVSAARARWPPMRPATRRPPPLPRRRPCHRSYKKLNDLDEAEELDDFRHAAPELRGLRTDVAVRAAHAILTPDIAAEYVRRRR